MRTMVLDFLLPFYYSLEKRVANNSIPNVSGIPNRMLLKDCISGDDGKAFDHSLWNSVLEKHVVPGDDVGEVKGVNTVDYDGVSCDENFTAYLEKLKDCEPDSLAKSEQLAFWMNAYNALCISLIVEHEKSNAPLNSINELSGDGGPVWDKIAGTVGGEGISLNTIEHVKLRGKWNEPALHGCIVCASASCPNLRPEAFVASRLREQMDDQMQGWMKNPTKGLVAAKGRLKVSRIFLWFGEDFGNMSASSFPGCGKGSDQDRLRSWIAQFVEDEKDKSKVQDRKGTLRFFDYSWQINRAKKVAGNK